MAMHTYNLFLESEKSGMNSYLDKETQLLAVKDAIESKKIYALGPRWNEKTQRVDFRGNVTINTNDVFNLEDLGFRFGRIIEGDFNCEGIEQKDLKGSPSECFVFDASHSNLISLEGGPDLVESFTATHCLIRSLKGSPRFVFGDFQLSRNMLKDLSGGPLMITGSIRLSLGTDTKDHNQVKLFQQMHKDILNEFGNINREISIKNIEEAIENKEYVAKILTKDPSYAIFMGKIDPIDLAKYILSKSDLEPSLLDSVRKKLPLVWDEITKLGGKDSGYETLSDLGDLGF